MPLQCDVSTYSVGAVIVVEDGLANGPSSFAVYFRTVGWWKEGNYPYFCGHNCKRDENRAELFVGGTQYVPPPGQDSLVYGVCDGGGIRAHPEG